MEYTGVWSTSKKSLKFHNNWIASWYTCDWLESTNETNDNRLFPHFHQQSFITCAHDATWVIMLGWWMNQLTLAQHGRLPQHHNFPGLQSFLGHDGHAVSAFKRSKPRSNRVKPFILLYVWCYMRTTWYSSHQVFQCVSPKLDSGNIASMHQPIQPNHWVPQSSLRICCKSGIPVMSKQLLRARANPATRFGKGSTGASHELQGSWGVNQLLLRPFERSWVCFAYVISFRHQNNVNNNGLENVGALQFCVLAAHGIWYSFHLPLHKWVWMCISAYLPLSSIVCMCTASSHANVHANIPLEPCTPLNTTHMPTFFLLKLSSLLDVFL
jgi:hypothetical protein